MCVSSMGSGAPTTKAFLRAVTQDPAASGRFFKTVLYWEKSIKKTGYKPLSSCTHSKRDFLRCRLCREKISSSCEVSPDWLLGPACSCCWEGEAGAASSPC